MLSREKKRGSTVGVGVNEKKFAAERKKSPVQAEGAG